MSSVTDVRCQVVVGRDAELALLGEALATALAGAGRAVFLTGEPGIGKTSLVRELWERLPSGTVFRIGRCLSYGRSVTYRPLADVLRQELGLRREDSTEDTLERLGGHRSRPESLQLAGRPRQHDDHAGARVEHHARCRAYDPERDGPLGQRRLFADTRCEIRVGPAHPLGEAPGDLLDLALQCRIDGQRSPGDARDELDKLPLPYRHMEVDPLAAGCDHGPASVAR